MLVPFCDSHSPSPTSTASGAAFDDSNEDGHEFPVHLEAQQAPSHRSNTEDEVSSARRIDSTMHDKNFWVDGNDLQPGTTVLDSQTVYGVPGDLVQAPVRSEQLEDNGEEILVRARSLASELQGALSNGPGALEQSLLQYCKCSADCVLSKTLTGVVSEIIAPQMVLVDNQFNGWRQLSLPIAFQDELVLNAILAASAYHIQINLGGSWLDSDRFYSRTLLLLRERRHLDRCDRTEAQCVLLAILILLVAVMVNASPDFPALFTMLRSALDALGGKQVVGEDEIAVFLRRQIRK